MNVYRSEDEQVEQLKKIVKTYGLPIIVGVIIALCIGYGWRYWQQQKIASAQAASTLYERLLNAYEQHDVKSVEAMAAELQQSYTRTPYASLSALLQARSAVDQKNYSSAQTHLQFAFDHTSSKALQQVITIRLARLDIEQHNPQAALTLLQDVKDDSYAGLIHATQGEAYAALHQTDKAHAAYQQAKAELPNNAVIKMKANESGW